MSNTNRTGDWRNDANAVLDALQWHYQRTTGTRLAYDVARTLARRAVADRGYPVLSAAAASALALELLPNVIACPELV